MSRNSGTFYWFFSSGSFFLVTYAEIRAFNWLKALFFCLSQQKKRTALKKLQKTTTFSGHVNRLIVENLKQFHVANILIKKNYPIQKANGQFIDYHPFTQS